MPGPPGHRESPHPQGRAKDGKERPRLNPTTQEVHYAGIDVSKGHLDVFVRPAGEHFGVPNDHAGIGSLVCRLLEGACPALVVLWRPPGASSALWPQL